MLVVCFPLDLMVGFRCCLAGRALNIPAQEDIIVYRNNLSCKTCSIWSEGITFCVHLHLLEAKRDPLCHFRGVTVWTWGMDS